MFNNTVGSLNTSVFNANIAQKSVIISNQSERNLDKIWRVNGTSGDKIRLQPKNQNQNQLFWPSSCTQKNYLNLLSVNKIKILTYPEVRRDLRHFQHQTGSKIFHILQVVLHRVRQVH